MGNFPRCILPFVHVVDKYIFLYIYFFQENFIYTSSVQQLDVFKKLPRFMCYQPIRSQVWKLLVYFKDYNKDPQ